MSIVFINNIFIIFEKKIYLIKVFAINYTLPFLKYDHLQNYFETSGAFISVKP